MLAARLDVKTLTLSLDDVPIPEPGRGQVRVKVRAAGVCLSDVHLVDGSVRPLHLRQDKVTLGHEIAGTIDAVGPGVVTYPVGQRVVLQAGEEHAGVLYARGVDYDGGWAEYTLATATTLVPIPDDLPFEQAAIIPDAVALGIMAFSISLFARPAMGAVTLALLFGMFSLTNGTGLIMQRIGLRQNPMTRHFVVTHRNAA